MYDVARFVRQDLYLYMARMHKKFFHVQCVIAERGSRLGAGHRHGIAQGCLPAHDAHPASATTGGGLDDDRVTQFPGRPADFIDIITDIAAGTGDAGHSEFPHLLPRRDFTPHQTDGISARADEYETAFLNPFGKIGIFSQESVTRMYRGGIGNLSRTDYSGIFR